MNGRVMSGINSRSEKRFIFNDVKFSKPAYLMNNEQKEVHNTYYENNPYFLNNNLFGNREKGVFNPSKHSNASRGISETSSQRSSKIVRANGLKLAEKPRILNGVASERQIFLTHSQNKEQTKKILETNSRLEEENRLLKQENQRLKENMRLMENLHSKEVESLNLKFESLLKRTEQLEAELEEENEWKHSIGNSGQSFMKN